MQRLYARLSLLLFVLGSTFLFLPYAVAAPTNSTRSLQAKAFTYQQIDTELVLQPDGSLDVTERLTLRFTGGSFSSASREIPLQRIDAIDQIQVAEQGAYREASDDSRTPNTFRVSRTATNLKVSWFYPPTSDSQRTFTLSYRAHGVLRVGREEDELWWVAIFPNRSVDVQSSRVVLRLPAAASLSSADVQLPAEQGQLTIDRNTVTILRTQALAPQTSLELQVRLPGDLISAPAPAWQGTSNPVDPTPINIEGHTDPNAQGAPISDMGGIASLVAICVLPLVLIVVVMGWLRGRNDPQTYSQEFKESLGSADMNAQSMPDNELSTQTDSTGSSWWARLLSSSSSSDTSSTSWWSSSSSSSSSDSSWSSSSDSSWSSSSDSSSSSDGGSGGGGGDAS